MTIDAMLSELIQERDQLDRAIAVLRGLTQKGTHRGPAKRVRRTLSPAARARIAAAQRKRWAKWKRSKKVTSIK